jgi:hypothetical protein
MVKSMVKSVAALSLAVALVSLPLAPLYCNDTGPKAMACCREKAANCNQPGTAGDDCCRNVPVEKAAAGPGQVIAGKPAWTAHISVDAVVPGVAPSGAAFSSVALRSTVRTIAADLAPPPLFVLRV